MNVRRLLLVALALALGLVSSVAHAGSGARKGPRGQDRNARWENLVARLDADKDGKISRAEFTSRHEMLDRLDTNKDGVASKDEIAAASATRPRVGEAVKRLDANGDGAVSAAELEEKRGEGFAKIDSDRDGYVVKGEFMAFKPQRGAGPDTF